MKTFTIIAALVACSALSARAAAFAPQAQISKPTAQEKAPTKVAADASAKPAETDVVRTQKPAYPLTTCIVSGEALGKDGAAPVEHVANGRLVRLCCKGCIKEVDKDTAGVLKKLDAAVVSAQKPTYPLKACPVTGEALGDAAVDHVHGTRLVRLANANAVATFEKDPHSALAKVDRALIEAQRASYRVAKCPVSDESVEGSADMVPADYLYGTRLVRFCCKSCIRTFEKNPEQYMAKLGAK